MLLIYTEHITPRVEYIFKLILEELAGFEIKLTANINEYEVYEGPSLNYSKRKIKPGELVVEPNGLLFQSTINTLTAFITKEGKNSFLFLQGNDIDHAVFDPFAAAFFLVSRYEEYFPFTPDEFNRFEAKFSVLYKYGLLEEPLIDQWALDIQKRILPGFLNLKVRSKKFFPVVTIDIDQAYAFKHKGFRKNLLSFGKNFLSRTEMLNAQIAVLLKKEKDPYDTYEYLKQLQVDTGLPFIYFVNIGTHSKYDKNLPHTNAALGTLLKNTHSYADIGMHPSYFSNEVPAKFSEEKKQLESVLAATVTKSRQHYLRLNFPDTYKHLIKAGITEDYTMGFASYPGFRAGTCTPFSWFDLEINAVTPLKIFPTTYMDGSFIEDLKMRPQEAEERIFSLIETVKKYNGCHVSIWHNHTVSNLFLWKNWRVVFENSLQKLQEANHNIV